MNFWCFDPSIFSFIEELFKKFLKESISNPKAEFFIPIIGDAFIKDKTAAILEELHLEKEAGVLVKSLPLGWKQKLAFSVAIFHEPEIVFLDEPTGGVDPVTRREFWNMIYQASERGITVFVTTHYMDEAEYCNRVSIMVDGRIDALDTPSQLKKLHHAASMDEVFLKLARKATRSET